MVRELFEMARSKKACLIFFDEIDAVGGARFDDGAGGDNEVQRTMLELINQVSERCSRLHGPPPHMHEACAFVRCALACGGPTKY